MKSSHTRLPFDQPVLVALFLQSFCIPAIHGGQMNETAPKRAVAGAPELHWRKRLSSARSHTLSTRPANSASRCTKYRKRLGNDNTH